ncbi:hypothetical protein [Calothrix sp. NIES-2098]|uniref:hypothetical protein n=1 Tax=Calothrix sp. NIES-2098 TaxID=1954171 RepID=UPI000B5EE8D5|nr:serine/threonine protein kinase [Calothrix sp. NIES-2098]
MANHNDDSNSDSSVTNHRYPKPPGNRIYLKKTDVALTIYIYPLHKFINKLDTKAGRLINGCLALAVIVFIPTLILMNIVMVGLVALMIYLIVFKLSIPCLFILILIILFPLRFTLETNYFFISQFSKVYLLINEHSFSLNWNFLGINYHVSGKTQDLRSVKVAELKTLKNIGFQTHLCLTQGIYSHKFGFGLFRNQQEWLAQEINDFLETWRSKHQ